MEGGALLEEAFAKFAEKVVLFCHITSHVEGEADPELLDEKGGDGFPYVIEMDADGNVVAQLPAWPPNVENFEKMAAKGDEYFALKKKADGGDKPAAIDLFIAQLELHHHKLKDAEAKSKSLDKPSEEQKKKIEEMLAQLKAEALDDEIIALFKGLGQSPDEAAITALGRKFLEMKKAGKIPNGNPQLIANFWSLIMQVAEKDKDVATFEEGIQALKAKFSDNPRAQQGIQQLEQKLEELKKGTAGEKAGGDKADDGADKSGGESDHPSDHPKDK